MVNKKKDIPKYTKGGEATTVFSKFLEKEPETGQLSARIEIEKFRKFKKLCADEGLSMAQATTISLDLLFDYYDREIAKKVR